MTQPSLLPEDRCCATCAHADEREVEGAGTGHVYCCTPRQRLVAARHVCAGWSSREKVQEAGGHVGWRKGGAS